MTADKDTKEIASLLKEAFPPMGDSAPKRDLWPALLHKLDAAPVAAPARIPWFDWALAAILGAMLIFFPGTIPALLYHL